MALLATRTLLLLSLALCVFAARDLAETSSDVSSHGDKDELRRGPPEFQVPPGYELAMNLYAKGHQYNRYNGTEWLNCNATAMLYTGDHEKKEIGRHFYLPHPDALGGQPSWETLPSKGVSHSIVTAKAVDKYTADQNSIPWVLLKATTSRFDKDYFGAVAFVKRFNTKGGLAPNSTSGAHEGSVRRSSYTANYAFYVRKAN